MKWLLPVVVFLVGFWFVPTAHTCGFKCVPGDLGDARFNSVILEHFFRWLTGQDASLQSPPFFYPMPGALAFSDNHWGTAWIYSIYRAVGLDRYEAFDAWYLTGYLANFIVCHCALRRLRFSSQASALGAFAFAFALPVIATHGHAQLTYRFLVPIGLLLWQRFRETGGWRWLGWLALAVAAQFYVAIYLGYFMLLLIAAWAVAQWIVDGFGPRQWFGQWARWSQPAARSELIGSLAMSICAFAALALLMQPYLHYSKLYGFGRAPDEIATMLPRAQSYLLADISTFWEGLSSRYITSVPMRPEQQMFFGVGITGLALFGVVRSANKARWVALGAFLALVILTLNLGGHSIYLLVARMPGLASIRAVSRIGVVMAMPLAFLVATGVDAARKSANPWRILAALLAVAMVSESIATWTIKIDIAQTRQRMERLRNRLPSPLPAHAVIFNPLTPDVAFYDSELDGVVLSQDLGMPTLNGYSGNIPPGYDPKAGDSACRQTMSRVAAASEFFAKTLKRPSPLTSSGPLLVIGQDTCSDMAWQVVPLNQLSRITLKINSIERHDRLYRIHVSIHNGSEYALNTALDASEPLRLSWQKVTGNQALAASAWISRVELGGKRDLLPGESCEVVVPVPVEPGERVRVAVSAVLEGRAWLHDHGFEPAWVDMSSQP
ncbi:hypothetical protein [Luteibacter sp. 9133]|uniref:hypothetical protein n=1 Tax=Luteibacter sp. 9133 TaxID=1500891 RepID=UPI0012E00EA3|nr:hypothetical protein [Luteibacter sp. 9133]